LPSGAGLNDGETLDLTVRGADGSMVFNLTPEQLGTTGIVGALVLRQGLSPLPISIVASLEAIVSAGSASDPTSPTRNFRRGRRSPKGAPTPEPVRRWPTEPSAVAGRATHQPPAGQPSTMLFWGAAMSCSAFSVAAVGVPRGLRPPNRRDGGPGALSGGRTRDKPAAGGGTIKGCSFGAPQ
jgi:hypothetical protein